MDDRPKIDIACSLPNYGPAASTLAAQLLQMRADLEPVFDTADGMRRDLEARGWSPVMAEHLAGAWLHLALTGGRR